MRSKLIFLAALAGFLLQSAVAGAQTLSSLSNQLATPTGEETSIAKIAQGKVTVVSFWATWCKPCKEEMKAMQPIYDRLKAKGLEYVAISIDNTKTMAKVAPYIASKGYNFPVLLDPNSDVFHALNGTDVPFTLIFKADGTLYSKHDGYLEGDESKLEQELTALLDGSAHP